MKRLQLLRHAKSDWSDPPLEDEERRLNRRGKRARKIIAQHVAGWPVDLVLCSTAVRARATAKPIVAVLGCPVRYERAIYAARGRELLELVRALPDDLDTVMLVGHNPALEELTATLCGSSPRYPTAALGTIELSISSWVDVVPGSGRLTAHITAAQLQASSVE
jgi:phosphohistidine phosphatase